MRKSIQILRFEYGVILNGSKTVYPVYAWEEKFEYGVILNGGKTMF